MAKIGIADFLSQILDWVKAENKACAVTPSPRTTATHGTGSSSIITVDFAILIILFHHFSFFDVTKIRWTFISLNVNEYLANS